MQLADAVATRARDSTVLLAIDDIQALDEVSLSALELLHAAALDASTTHLLIVASHRPLGAADHVLARIDRSARSNRSSEIRLTGLDEPGLAQLVADATAIPPTPALIDALSAASGNPLISLAFLQSLADAGARGAGWISRRRRGRSGKHSLRRA